VDEPGACAARRLRENLWSKGVQLFRQRGVLFGLVDIRQRGAVNDQIRGKRANPHRDILQVCQVHLFSVEWHARQRAAAAPAGHVPAQVSSLECQVQSQQSARAGYQKFLHGNWSFSKSFSIGAIISLMRLRSSQSLLLLLE